jgi:hypothetical protein
MPLSSISSICLLLNCWLIPEWLSILEQFISKRLQSHFHSGFIMNLINITLWLNIHRREQNLNRELITVLFVGACVLTTISSVQNFYLSYGSQVLDISSRQNDKCTSGFASFWTRAWNNLIYTRLYTVHIPPASCFWNYST